jgi:hypothetical protein
MGQQETAVSGKNRIMIFSSARKTTGPTLSSSERLRARRWQSLSPAAKHG